MHVPTELLYTEEHEWARKGDDGVVTVGITAFAAEQLGAVVYVELPAEGDAIAKGDAVGQVESTKSVSDLYAPLSGTVLEVNSTLEDNPDLINGSPYGDGWLFKMRVEDSDELDELLDAQGYSELIAEG
jgi:glycine cleavage system H protein